MYAPTTSLLRRLPAGLKFALALAVVLAASLLPRHLAPYLALPAGVVLLAIPLARLPLWPLARRILLLEPFVLGVALLAFFRPLPAGSAPVERWYEFGFLVARCTVALVAMVLFTAATPFADILRLFQKLRVPALLVTTLALMHRYIFVLADESARMRRARQSRTFTGRQGHRWQTLSTIIAQLFLRASDRADRIYDAMRARGWNSDE
jgi:cobalt/nickel transport system permease protein